MVSIFIVHDNGWLTLHLGKSLLWVAALGLIVIYIYAVGTFVFMPSDFDNQDEGEVVRYCSTLFECSITVLEYGLLDTIGVVSNLAIILVTLFCLVLDSGFTKKPERCHFKSNFLWSFLFRHCDHHRSEHCVWHHCGYILWTKRWEGNLNYSLII